MDDPCSIPKTVIFFPTKKEAVEGFDFLQRSAAQKHYVGSLSCVINRRNEIFCSSNFFIKDH